MLQDGRVLVAGGFGDSGPAPSNGEVYDQVANSGDTSYWATTELYEKPASP